MRWGVCHLSVSFSLSLDFQLFEYARSSTYENHFHKNSIERHCFYSVRPLSSLFTFVHVCHFVFHHQTIDINSITYRNLHNNDDRSFKKKEKSKHKVNVFCPIDILKIKYSGKKITEQHRITSRSRNKQTVWTVYRFFLSHFFVVEYFMCFHMIAFRFVSLLVLLKIFHGGADTQNICIYTYVNS